MAASPSDCASPWHAGEIVLQQEAGVAEHMTAIGPRVIRDHMIEQHRLFFPMLSFVVLGTVDPERNPWATIRVGEPGFLSSENARQLRVATALLPDDPAERGLIEGSAIGLLGIEPATRRRNRLNGVVRRGTGSAFVIDVAQSFGNCPKYIHPYSAHLDLAAPGPGPVDVASRLDGPALRLVATADTFFVATFAALPDASLSVDVSHRGGPPGFVRIDPEGRLLIPDFSGNRFFNTLGNVLNSGRAGLVFIDGASGDLVQISGDARVLRTDAASLGPGVERTWEVTPRHVVIRPRALNLRLV